MSRVTLEERMARLERANRKLKLGMLAVVVGMAGLVSLAATKPVAKVVRAERFEILDSKGDVRGEFGMIFYGIPGVCLRDDNGKVRASLEVPAHNGPALRLLDRDSKAQATLMIWSFANPVLCLQGKDGQLHASLAVDPGGSELSMVDKNGRFRAVLSFHGTPELVLRDENLKACTSLALLHPDGRPSLNLRDKAGKLRGVFELSADGSPSLALADRDGSTLWKAP